MTNVFVVSDNLQTLFDVANEELKKLSNWISANRLHVNYDKTNFMISIPKSYITKPSIFINKSKILFNGHSLEQVHSVKYLGVIIDDELNWSAHINSLSNNISSMIGILYRNKNYLPMYCKKIIYFALIYSKITYCVEIYANTNKSIIKPLIVKCNRFYI